MIAPLEVRKNILTSLIAAEKSGNPMKLTLAVNMWGTGSAWESLVDSGYIERYPEAVTVTASGYAWLENFCPEVSVEAISAFDFNDASSCEFDRMTKSQKIAFFVFLVSVVLWGAPIYEQMFGIKLSWVMPLAGVSAIISGLYSGIIFIILNSFNKK